MKKVLRRRPSGAMIIAIVALIAALAGTAIAGGGFVTKTKFKKFKKNTNTQLTQTLKGPVTYVTTNTPDVDDNFGPGAFATATATCPAGTKVVGGGIKGEFPEDDFIFDSYPTATGWSGRVFANHGAGTTSTFITTAICATGTSTGSPPAS
jgi:hypothetical protein